MLLLARRLQSLYDTGSYAMEQHICDKAYAKVKDPGVRVEKIRITWSPTGPRQIPAPLSGLLKDGILIFRIRRFHNLRT